MITYNEAKQLLNQGIFPCLIYKNGNIDYIISYDDGDLSCISFYRYSYAAENENSELFKAGGGSAIR